MSSLNLRERIVWGYMQRATIQVLLMDGGRCQAIGLTEPEKFTGLICEAPVWLQESLALLTIVDAGDGVEGVGYRHGPTSFYLVPKGGL